MRSNPLSSLSGRVLLTAALILTACGGPPLPDERAHGDAGVSSDAGTGGRADAGVDAGTRPPPAGGCTPQCGGKTCGPDGCGGQCGSCGTGQACDTSGQCVCVPRCDGRSCGPDGCGGTCGTCPLNATCSAAGDCRCADGYVPNAQHTGCIRVGGACDGVSAYGYCSGDAWVRCDAQEGIVAIDCGPGMCKTLQQGLGACRCGSMRGEVCTAADGTTRGNKVLFTCLTNSDVLAATNCAEETGSPNGFCSTYVTSVGHQTSCFCDTCSAPMSRDNTCTPLCGSASRCSYNAKLNTHTCW